MLKKRGEMKHTILPHVFHCANGKRNKWESHLQQTEFYWHKVPLQTLMRVNEHPPQMDVYPEDSLRHGISH